MSGVAYIFQNVRIRCTAVEATQQCGPEVEEIHTAYPMQRNACHPVQPPHGFRNTHVCNGRVATRGGYEWRCRVPCQGDIEKSTAPPVVVVGHYEVVRVLRCRFDFLDPTAVHTKQQSWEVRSASSACDHLQNL